MTAETHRQLASFIWGICNLLCGPYYEAPRPLETIEADIKQLEGEIVALLKEVTA